MKIVLVAAGALGLLSSGALGQEQETGDLVVRINNVDREQGGSMKIAIYSATNAASFPSGFKKADRTRSVQVSELPSTGVRFADIPLGTYAVSVYQDIDGDGEADANFLGMPTEPVGASNDASGFLGPPEFDEAAVRVQSETTEITINLHSH